ncbi:MAG: amidase [Deltaproteobacteria bacterium]|nr:amidase [Deltaproteobacteria bacterium]
MEDLAKLTLVKLVEAIKKKKISPVELMKATLRRIEQTNTDLNAVVARYDEKLLLANAKKSEGRVMRGEARPLEGIPLGVKDLEDARGLVTSMGSLPFRNQVAQRDSTQVQRLRAAGAIVVGKTNAPEFGYTAITKNRVYGVTRSPWNLTRTPGGSSGGSAAALAGGVLPLVTSSDGGGSVRIPASFVGAFGLKPSYGRVPVGPITRWIYGDTTHYGATTKTVEDAALFLDQVAGYSPYDPKSLPNPGLSYFKTVKKPLSQKLRIGFSPDLGYAVVQSDIASAVEEGVKVFKQLGHRIKEIKGGPPLLLPEWGMFAAFELASRLCHLFEEHEEEFGRSFLAGPKSTRDLTCEQFGQMEVKRAQLNDWCAATFEMVDLLVTPTVPFDPPPAGGPFPEETEGRKQYPAAVASFTVPFNLSWHPAATVRAGLSKAGLPIGLQIVGPRFREDLVLQAARAFELEKPWHPGWPTSW